MTGVLSTMLFSATLVLGQTTGGSANPRPAVMVPTTDLDGTTVSRSIESSNRPPCARLATLSTAQSNTSEPPASALPIGADAATTPVVTMAPDGEAGYCSNPIMGSVEYYKGTWYYSSQIPPVGSVPSNAIIYQVSWTYSLSTTPVGQRVWLCDSVKCVEITGQPQGSTQSFNGDPANTNFEFEFYVTGSGQLSPWVTVSALQVCNNYSY